MKNIAAIGGALTISMVRITPMPPCCIAIAVRLSCGVTVTQSATQNAIPTAISMSMASVIMTVSSASENKVPRP